MGNTAALNLNNMTTIKYDGTSYNADWIKSHSEKQFIDKVASMVRPLSAEKARELHNLVVPKTTTNGNDIGNAKKGKGN